jgi:hypothetical protein
VVDHKPKVLVIGAQGALGRRCVPRLRRAGFEVIRGGRREDAADFRLVDLDDPESVPAACADADLIISMVYDTRRTVERMVLSEGGAMFSLVVAPEERAGLRALGKGAKGLVVTDIGLGPGVSSLVFKALVDRFPETDELENIGTFSMREPAGRGTAEEFSYPAFTSAPRHETLQVDLPAPYGRGRAISLVDPEVGIALVGGLGERFPVSTYVYIVEAPERVGLLALNRIGLLSRLPLAAFTFGATRKAGSTVLKPQHHIHAVLKDGKRLGACLVSGNGNFEMTAAATGVCAEALIDRQRAGDLSSGVRAVEEVFDLAEVRPGFEAQGIQISPT